MSEKKSDVSTSAMPPNGQPKKPLVFISHDTRDAEIAECFSKLLSGASAGILKSFRSSDKKGSQGIQYGVEWYPEIMGKLDDATDVVCLLTKNSLERPWILFEAGVAKGKLDTTVLGIAIGIPLNNASSGPFAQFQNCADDEDSVTRLVMQLVSKIPGSEPDKDVIRSQVGIFLGKTQKLTKTATVESPEEISHETSVAKLFEEIKVMYSELPDKICKTSNYERRKSPRNLNPKIMYDVVRIAPNSRTGLYMLLSIIKDDFPWIYESGAELLKHRIAHSPVFLDKYKEFAILVEFTFKNPITREIFGLGSDMMEYSYLLLQNFDQYINDEREEKSMNLASNPESKRGR